METESKSVMKSKLNWIGVLIFVIPFLETLQTIDLENTIPEPWGKLALSAVGLLIIYFRTFKTSQAVHVSPVGDETKKGPPKAPSGWGGTTSVLFILLMGITISGCSSYRVLVKEEPVEGSEQVITTVEINENLSWFGKKVSNGIVHYGTKNEGNDFDIDLGAQVESDLHDLAEVFLSLIKRIPMVPDP